MPWLAERNKPRFRVASVEQGDLRITVNAAGHLEPTLSVKVGRFVSGPVLELYADHHDEVKAKQVLAKIDPRLYEAAVQRDDAALAAWNGDVARVKAELQRARNDETVQRQMKCADEKSKFIQREQIPRDEFTFRRVRGSFGTRTFPETLNADGVSQHSLGSP